MRKKTFVHICEEFEYTWIGKDNGLFPIYAYEVLEYESKIVTCNLKNDLPDEVRGIEIIKIPRWFKKMKKFASWVMFLKRIPLYKYICRNAKEIDVLMLFHITKCSYWNAYFYKKFNPNGKVFIKADFNLKVYEKEIEKTQMKPKNLREFFRKRREIKEYDKRKKLVYLADLISYETKEAYNVMKDCYAGVSTKGKIKHIPNGYDSKLIDSLNFKKNFENKENIMITVGRLGTKEKNTELLLQALEKVELKDWKIYLIGGIEESFFKKIEEFFKKNPNKKNNVIFTGLIKDKKELYDYYYKSKVFLLTSRWEGFALVYLEALAMGNYIVTTDVGGARDVTNNSTIGEIIESNNIALINSLERIIKGEIDLKKKYNEAIEKSKEFDMKILIKKIEKL